MLEILFMVVAFGMIVSVPIAFTFIDSNDNQNETRPSVGITH